MGRIDFNTYCSDFVKVRKLGQGNCAKVYLVKNIKTQKFYARKAIFFSNIDQITHAVSEIEIINQIADKAVPKIFFYFIKETKQLIENHHISGFQFSIIMERCDTSLEGYLHPEDNSFVTIQNQEIWKFLLTMSPLFAKMQRLKILHRDIKPANFLVNIARDGKIQEFKLSDFGYSVPINQYSARTITGTKEYVSPRIYSKFIYPEQDVKEINFKDDVFSLGKTILQMATQKNYSNQLINEKFIRQSLKDQNDQRLVQILIKMLKYDEDQRVDFLQLEELVNKKSPYKKVSQIDLESTNQEGKYIQTTGFYQNYTSPYQSQKNQTEKQRKIEQCIEPTKKKYLKLNSHDDDETIYLVNQKEGQSHYPPKLYLKKREIDFRSNEIFCIKVVGDFAFLGMNSRLAVIPLNQINKKGNAYLLKLRSFNSLKSDFKIKKIQEFQSNIVLLLEDDYIITIDLQKISGAMQYIFENHTELEKESTLKQLFKHYHSSIVNFAKIYEISFQDFNVVNFKETVSCVQISDHYFYDAQSQTILGYGNGQIKLYQDITIYQGKQRIQEIKVFAKNKMIFSAGNQITILEILQINSQTKLKSRTYNQSFQSQVLYFKIIGQSAVEKDEDDLIPFVKVITKDGKAHVLTQHLQTISFNRLEKSSTIRYVSQTNFNWLIKKEKVNNQQNFVVDLKKIPNKHQNNSSLSYLSSSGLLKYVDSRKSLCQVQFDKVSCYHIDADKIVICKLNGRVQVLYISNEPPKKVPPGSLIQNKEMKPTQSTDDTSRSVQNGSQYNESQNINESFEIWMHPSHHSQDQYKKGDFRRNKMLDSEKMMMMKKRD